MHSLVYSQRLRRLFARNRDRDAGISSTEYKVLLREIPVMLFGSYTCYTACYAVVILFRDIPSKEYEIPISQISRFLFRMYTNGRNAQL